MTSKELLLHEIERMSEKQLHEMLIIAQSIRAESLERIKEDEKEIITSEILEMAENSYSFDFLNDEPEIYSLDDGVPIG